MLDYLRKKIPNTHPLRLFYHKILAVLAALWYWFPANKLRVIAVTGTNGKTTTVNLIAQILEEAGHTVGMASTINFQIGEKKWTNLTKKTTQGPFFLQKLLREMKRAECDYAVLEISSHSIIQSRLWGVNVDLAVFTNISHEHLDYHRTFEEYLKAKGRLFEQLNFLPRKPHIPKITVINGDDLKADYFKNFVADRSYVYGIEKGVYQARQLDLRPEGSSFSLKIPNEEEVVNLKLPGKFNVYNALAAATVGIACSINLKIVKAALEKARCLPGRLELIEEGQKYTIVVDFAHTPVALENLVRMYRELTKGKLTLVFGATGERDREKRPKMGEIADQYADLVIVTNDDPYGEDPWQIIEEVGQGIKREEGENFWKIPNRKEAIRLALALAREGDTVLVAGKGCEEFQVVDHQKIPFDDRKVVRELLSREVEIEIESGEVKTGNPYFES